MDETKLQQYQDLIVKSRSLNAAIEKAWDRVEECANTDEGLSIALLEWFRLKQAHAQSCQDRLAFSASDFKVSE